VRIGTTDTTYSSIIRIALAAEDSIRLESHIELAIIRIETDNPIDAPMAGTAELLTDLITTQNARVEDRSLLWLPVTHRPDVADTGAMTSFTAYPDHHLLQMQTRMAD